MKPIGSLTLFTVVISVSAIAYADWPQFRGTWGQGVSRVQDVPLHWNANDGVAWKTELPGEGWSSPVLSRGKIYVTAAIPRNGENAANGYSLQVLCLDAAQGELVWESETFTQESDAPKIHTKNSHASPTPVVVHDALFVHFGHQGTARLDLDGNIIWRNNSIPYQPVHGNGGSPVVDGKRLIFSIDGSRSAMVVALDIESGDEIWRFDRQSSATKKFSFSTPTLIDVQGQKQLVSPASDAVQALDPATGRMIWMVRYSGYSVIPKPVFDGNLVYVCTGYDRASLLAIRPNGSGDVTDTHVVWQTSTSVPKTPSLLLNGGNLFMVADNGVASCLSAFTGTEVWRERLEGGFSASPISALGRIYITNESGKTFVIDASNEFNVLAENDLQERALASLAVTEGAIYLRTERHLYCIGTPPKGG